VSKQQKASFHPFSTLIAPDEALAAARRLASHLPPYGAEAFREEDDQAPQLDSPDRSYDIA
jgi:hypothetical protein